MSLREPVVLVPGLMCDARVFAGQIGPLSSERPVMVAPPLAGERIEEIASNLLGQLPHRFALLGQGLGGMVALELLRRAPERITRVALFSTVPLPPSPDEAASKEATLVKARAGRLLEALETELPDGALAPGADRPAIRATMRAMAEALGPQVFVQQMRAIQRRKDQQAVLRKVIQPALVLCGRADSVVPVKRQSFMAEMIPHARFEVLDTAGHLPTLEAPEATLRAVQRWLGQPLVLR